MPSLFFFRLSLCFEKLSRILFAPFAFPPFLLFRGGAEEAGAPPAVVEEEPQQQGGAAGARGVHEAEGPAVERVRQDPARRRPRVGVRRAGPRVGQRDLAVTRENSRFHTV